jgi:phosphatidylglycerophosphatase A
MGSLWGWLAWLVLAPLFTTTGQGILILLAMGVGWWACKRTVDHLDVADPGYVVWDEIVAMWLILWLVMPSGFWGQLIAFALFRFFDAVKPGPVAWADAVFKGWGWRGAWGIMFDDLVAAFCTLFVIALWRFIA